MATPHATGTQIPAKGGFPAFRVETYGAQLLWLAIAFGLLYYLMAKHAIPRIREILETRSDQIADDLAEAQRLKSETDAAIASYEKSLADARLNAQTIAGQTRDQVNAEADAQRKTLEAQLATRLAAAETQILATKSAAMGNVRGIATDAAAAMVERLVGKAPARASLEAALDAALKR